MSYLIQFLVTAGAIFALANSGQVEGIFLENGYISALIFAVILALVNLILGTALKIITTPIRFLTLGLFSFVISLIIVYVTDQFVPAVTLVGIIPVVAVAIVQAVTSFVLKIFL